MNWKEFVSGNSLPLVQEASSFNRTLFRGEQ
jgi:hypothetical protein